MPNESELPSGTPAEMHPPTVRGRGPGYEVRDTNVWAVITFIVGLFAALIVTQFGLWGLLNAIAGGYRPPAPPASPYAESARPGDVPLTPPGKVTPEVVLEITEQRRRLGAEEDATLGGYAWVDNNNDEGKPKEGGPARVRTGGPVRIPIDRAIELIAERGVPATGGPPRTEVQVNSHSGEPAPAGSGKTDGPASKDRGASEKGSKK